MSGTTTTGIVSPPIDVRPWSTRLGLDPTGARLGVIAGTVAVAAAAVAMTVTFHADFLKYPGWLAVQKADLILGPVLVGVYWLRRRPASRFGWLLIAFGLANTVYIAQSSSRPALFGLGVMWESAIYLGTQILIVTFPTGRVRGLAAKLIIAGSVANAAFNVWLVAMLPQTGAGGAISHCKSACPRNGLAFAPDTERALDLIDTFEITVIVVAAATVLLLVWRLVNGSPPQRRALAIGAPVSIAFLVLQITYLALTRWYVDAPNLLTTLQWSFTVVRSAVWYGFLAALIAAQLFAGRALRTLVRQSLRRPSQRDLEQMLREPLGDPTLRLRFWDAKAQEWDGGVEPPAGSMTTVVDRDGRPSVALIHDAELADDPELLQTAGVVALLAAENAELDTGWKDALLDLQESRGRIVEALDEERQRLASDLHDGVQQHLGAIRLRVAGVARTTHEAPTSEQLEAIAVNVGEAIDELRNVSYQLYPHVLMEQGLTRALQRALDPLPVQHDGMRRTPLRFESTVYYCVLEAVQNATKHGGAGVSVDVHLACDDDTIRFEVTDDGPGFDPHASHAGMGLTNLRDRVGALAGTLAITSKPGSTTVAGSIPLRG